MPTPKTAIGLTSCSLLLLICGAGLCWTTPACATVPVQTSVSAESAPQVQEGQPKPTEDKSQPVGGSDEGPSSANTVGAAEREILAKWAKISACSARIKIEATTGQMVIKPGGAWESQMYVHDEGTYELFRQDDKIRVRMEMTGQSHIRFGLDDDGTSSRKVLRIYDGAFVYSVEEERGKTTASKTNLSGDDFIHLGGGDYFEGLHARFLLQLLPDETLGTRETYVIEARPKQGEGRIVHWFDKNSGLIIQMSTFDKTGKLQNRLTLDEINLEPKFREKRFTFVPPRGVEVVDLTQQ